MSERILKALIQLFAIIARVDGDNNKDGLNGRQIVERFLKERLPQKLIEEYLRLFNSFLEIHQKVSSQKSKEHKRTSVNSVKVLRICTEINEELTQRQKVIVMITLLEFINAHEEISEQEEEFVNTVAETFNFDLNEYRLMKAFIFDEQELLKESTNILYVAEDPNSINENNKYLKVDGLDGIIAVLRVPSVNLHFVKYSGDANLNITGQSLSDNRHYILNQGTSIRGSKISPIYYSDIISTFLSDNNGTKISFKAAEITYKFKKGNIGLHQINIFEDSGKLLGIMGASGSGKSTLLNVLNGTLAPAEGTVSINGYDVHSKADKIQGVVGYVAQDDLLIDELTVYENLYFNTKLCFGDSSDEEIAARVLSTLNNLGLTDTKDLKVGNPMDKTISGGQRKRLNIALELIREPSVLFVDEPTSGLSSRDSENIMDLLKELTLKGKLIFVVIH